MTVATVTRISRRERQDAETMTSRHDAECGSRATPEEPQQLWRVFVLPALCVLGESLS